MNFLFFQVLAASADVLGASSSPVRPKSGKSLSKTGRSGLTSVADTIHKNDEEDLSKLSETEQLELAMRASKIESMSVEEQVFFLTLFLSAPRSSGRRERERREQF